MRSSVIVNNLDREGIAVSPPETDPPLIIDANTVLAGAIAFQLLQAVAGRDPEILQPLGGVYHTKFPEHEPVELGGEAADPFALKEALRIAIGEAGDHRG